MHCSIFLSSVFVGVEFEFYTFRTFRCIAIFVVINLGELKVYIYICIYECRFLLFPCHSRDIYIVYGGENQFLFCGNNIEFRQSAARTMRIANFLRTVGGTVLFKARELSDRICRME